MILSCKEVTRLVSQGLDRDLSLGERTMLRLHFAICQGCRNVNRQFASLRSAIRRLSEEETKGSGL